MCSVDWQSCMCSVPEMSGLEGCQKGDEGKSGPGVGHNFKRVVNK